MRALVFCALFFFSSLGLAQQISDDFRRDIVDLMEATGSLKLGEQMGNAVAQQMIAGARASDPNIPARAVEIISEVTTSFISRFMNSPETMDSIVALYAKYFTQEEIKTVTAFYATPTGKKVISAMPILTAESMQMAQRRMTALVPELQAELARKLSAEGFSVP
jgi:uncharacterized protein